MSDMLDRWIEANCDSWSCDDTRKTRALSTKSLAEVQSILQQEQQRVTATTIKRVDVVVIDAAV